jgi:hypothetical protein
MFHFTFYLKLSFSVFEEKNPVWHLKAKCMAGTQVGVLYLKHTAAFGNLLLYNVFWITLVQHDF